MLIPRIWQQLSIVEKAQLLQRPQQNNQQNIADQVKAMITKVRQQGDAGLKALTAIHDRVTIDHFRVSDQEIADAQQQVAASDIAAMRQIITQLMNFHLPQKPQPLTIETAPGVICESHPRAIGRVGLYIPAGSAPLVSTVLMLAIPAKIAECPLIVLCSPPNHQGLIDPHIATAAKLCGIDQMFKVGGAQAIAALAFGTETIPKVDKIFGPGNRWVTQAKLQVAQTAEGAMYDLPAGPSEVMVIADQYANPAFIAADLLSQAEHGPDSQVLLLCTDGKIATAVNQALTQQITTLPRQAIARQSLQQSHLIIVDHMTTALEIVNSYAPEHLIMQVVNPRRYLAEIQCAGSIFLGPWSPESAGDYASGTNHVLPTDGFAKCLSGLAVKDFMKSMSVQELTRAGLTTLAPAIAALTKIEGLQGHDQAVKIRLASESII